MIIFYIFPLHRSNRLLSHPAELNTASERPISIDMEVYLMKISMTTAALVLSSLLFLAGCSGTTAAPVDLMSGIAPAAWPTAPQGLDDRFQSAVSDFSWDMFKRSSANEGSVLISPASVYLALGMTLNGARGDTREAMLSALHSSGLSEEDLNKACRDWISFLKQTSGKTQLSVADSIWFRQTFEPDKTFLQKNADFFAAAVRRLDFNDPSSVRTINAWVKESTRGVIDSIVDKINADVMMYLINAVYFKGTWLSEFDAADTGDGDFAAPAGSVTVKYMHKTGELAYLDQDRARGVMLPYDDGRFSFFAVLPPEGTDVRAFISSMDGVKASALLAGVKSGRVELSLPKFETEYRDSLKDELSAMGMGLAFDAGSADFSSMNAAHQKNLYIGDVQHKTFCRVDELGTEAGAVTSVEIRLTAAPPQDNIIISFDRPFVYGIMDGATGLPLFIGLMEDPSK
jgi:serine protease inhibitor